MRPFTLLEFHFFSLWNWRASYLGRFLEPIAYLAFLTAGLSRSVAVPDGDYLGFATAGLFCFIAFRSATSTVSDVANDRKWGVTAIYTLQGGSMAGYLASILMFGALVFAAQIIIVIAVGSALFGFAAIGGPPLLARAAMGLLLVAGWIGIGAAVAARVQSYAVRDLVITVTSLPVVLSAPLFYPLASVPPYLHAIALANPLTYQVGWMRSGPAGPTLLFATVWAVGALSLALVMLSRADRVSRER